MPTSLTEALADRLDLSPEEADEAIADFVADVRRRVSRDGSAVVPGLGVFRRHVGALVFEPDLALALAVNHRFAGLGDVTIDASEPAQNYRKTEFFAAPEDDEPEPAMGDVPDGDGEEVHEVPPARDLDFEIEEFDDEPNATPEDATSYEEAPDTPFEDEDGAEASPYWEADPAGTYPLGTPPDIYEEADFQVVDADATDADADDEDVVPEDEPYAPPSLTPVAPPLDDLDVEAHDDSVSPQTPETPDPAVPDPSVGSATEPIPPAPPGRSTPADAEEPRRRSPVPLIVGALVLIAAIAAALFLLPDSDPTPAAPPTAEEVPPPATDTLAGVAPLDTSMAAVAPETTAAEPAPAPAADETPLRGAALDPEAGGYTLVVSSWMDAGTAETDAARYRAEGYRTGVLAETTDGTTRYRVAVGQFATLDAADEARTAHADDLPAGVWVLRIR